MRKFSPFVILLLSAGMFICLNLPAFSATPTPEGPLMAITPRPTWEPYIPGGRGEGEEKPGNPPGGSVRGTIINWGFRNEPRLPIKLSGGDWALETLSDDNGFYIFNNLGAGVALLNPLLSEASGLRSMITDLAIPLDFNRHLVVNLGVYGGPDAPKVLPVELTKTVEPQEASPGSNVLYKIRAVNRLPTYISHVLFTDYLPEGLYLLEATSNRSKVDVRDRLVAVDIGELEPGGEALITIRARLSPEMLDGAVIINRSSLIYEESVAVQAEAELKIKKQVLALAPSTPAAATPTSPTPAAATLSPPSELPITGFSIPTPILGGMALAALAFLVRALRVRSL
ncbi:MAG: hypothetical protein ACUVV0_07355 [Anaerolineae bacterium]